MAAVKFGLTFTASYLDVGEFAERTESLGFDSLWVGEHVANWRPSTTVVPMLAAYAARTKRITVGSAVILLPLRHPTLIAKDLAVLDYISNGRLAVGVGIGGENPAEFAACNVPIKQRAGRTDELLQILPRLWTEEAVTYHGKYYTLDGVTINPRPQRPGGIPLYVAGRREPAMRRAARFSRGFMPYLLSPEQYAKTVAQVRAFAAEENRDPDSLENILHQSITVADTKDEARRIMARGLQTDYQQDFTNLVDRFCVMGTPEDCIARLRDYIDAGVQHVIFRLASQREVAPEEATRIAREQMARIANEILPAFR